MPLALRLTAEALMDANWKFGMPSQLDAFTNDDLWEVIDRLNIPRWKVRFTCMDWKAPYLFHTNSVFHLDDNEKEFSQMRNIKCKTVGVQVSSGGFQNKCNRILFRSVDNR